MFKNLKSFFFVYLFYKNQKKFINIVIGLFIIILSFAIYPDLKEYFNETNKKEYLIWLLTAKWLIIISAFIFIFYNIKKLSFKKDEKTDKSEKNQKEKKIEKTPEDKHLEKFRNRKLKTKADLIIEKKKREKAIK